jgi:hypothetical protein
MTRAQVCRVDTTSGSTLVQCHLGWSLLLVLISFQVLAIVAELSKAHHGQAVHDVGSRAHSPAAVLPVLTYLSCTCALHLPL